MINWINVQDNLPDIDTIVLIAVKSSYGLEIRTGVLEKVLNKIEWYNSHCSCAEFPNESVTHWMKLPKVTKIKD